MLVSDHVNEAHDQPKLVRADIQYSNGNFPAFLQRASAYTNTRITKRTGRPFVSNLYSESRNG